MKSYVISLDRAAERRDSILHNFEQFGIDFQVVSGIDWLDITDQMVLDNLHPDYFFRAKNLKRPHVHGILACWLSHRKVWKLAIERNQKIVAIFEDDCELTVDTKPALKAIEASGTNKFDIVFLYHGKPKKPLYPILKIDDKFAFNLVKYESIGAVGYVITIDAMKTLLKNYPLMNIHIDALMHYYWWHGLKTYILTPQVTFHGSFGKAHHSYNEEGVSIETLERLGLTSNSHYLVKKLRRFYDRLISKYLPQFSAFQKRLKLERSESVTGSRLI